MTPRMIRPKAEHLIRFPEAGTRSPARLRRAVRSIEDAICMILQFHYHGGFRHLVQGDQR